MSKLLLDCKFATTYLTLSKAAWWWKRTAAKPYSSVPVAAISCAQDYVKMRAWQCAPWNKANHWTLHKTMVSLIWIYSCPGRHQNQSNLLSVETPIWSFYTHLFLGWFEQSAWEWMYLERTDVYKLVIIFLLNQVNPSCNIGSMEIRQNAGCWT